MLEKHVVELTTPYVRDVSWHFTVQNLLFLGKHEARLQKKSIFSSNKRKVVAKQTIIKCNYHNSGHSSTLYVCPYLTGNTLRFRYEPNKLMLSVGL
jgi:hypothetical protein